MRIAELLRGHAGGLCADEAAVELLIWHGHWMRGPACGVLVRAGDGEAAWIDWEGAVSVLEGGGMGCSSSEAAVLRIAASLGGGVPVDLRAALGGLDHRNIALVTAAVVHANGDRGAAAWPRPGAGSR